jgi:hypothetical protein
MQQTKQVTVVLDVHPMLRGSEKAVVEAGQEVLAAHGLEGSSQPGVVQQSLARELVDQPLVKVHGPHVGSWSGSLRGPLLKVK